MRTPHQSRRGLTLIELISSLTIFLIVVATLVVALNASVDTWRRSREHARLVVTARAALERITDDLHHAVADSNHLFRIGISTNPAADVLGNFAEFHCLAPGPSSDTLAASGDVRWYVQSTNNLGALVREFAPSDSVSSNTTRLVLVEGAAALYFYPLGIDTTNVPSDELIVSNLPPVVDVCIELLSPADGRRAQSLPLAARAAFVARRSVRLATRVVFDTTTLPPQDKPASYLCSGRIIDGASEAGLAGVQVTFIGPSTHSIDSIYSTSDGSYSNNIPSWWRSYTIKPQPPNGRTGVYDPQQRVCRLSQGDLAGQDFRWTPSDLVISGRVTYAGSGLAGVRISFPHAGESETGDDGYYAIGINYGWPYGTTVYATPWHPHGGTFSPVSRGPYPDLQQSMSGQDYVWTPPSLVISGYVVKADANVGIVDAVVSFSGSGAPAAVRTGADGFYVRDNIPYPWTGLVTPSLPPGANAGGYFEPSNWSYENLVRNARLDFVWTQWPVAVSGTVFYADTSQGIPDVIVSFDNNGPSVTTRSDGRYTGYVPNQWTGTAIPSYPAPGVFVPPQILYDTPLTAAVANQDYRWYAFEYVIAGRVTETNALVAVTNASIRFITQQGYAAASNLLVYADGSYTNRVSSGWYGVVAPAYPTNGVFTPSSNTYVNVTSNWFGQDFQWKP